MERDLIKLLKELDSPFSQLYLAIEKKIKDAVPEIRMVAIDIGQLDYYETRPAVTWPCVLIDFSEANFSNEGENVQWMDGAVLLRVGFSPFSQATSITPDVSMKTALGFFEIENKIYTALQGWSPSLPINGEEVEICQPMSRVSAITEKRDDPFRVRIMIMVTAGEDAGAKNYSNKRKATIELEQ